VHRGWCNLLSVGDCAICKVSCHGTRGNGVEVNGFPARSATDSTASCRVSELEGKWSGHNSVRNATWRQKPHCLAERRPCFFVYRWKKRCPEGILCLEHGLFASTLIEKLTCLCLSHEGVVGWEVNASCWYLLQRATFQPSPAIDKFECQVTE
jgi:hypothetical protein